MYTKSDFSSKLTLLRKDRGLSIAQLAQMLGISFEAVRLMERGKRSPSVEVLNELVAIFDVPADFFLSRPPFDNWDAVLSCRQAVLVACAHLLDFKPDSFSAASDADLVRLIGATCVKIEADPDQRRVTLFPFFTPEDFRDYKKERGLD